MFRNRAIEIGRDENVGARVALDLQNVITGLKLARDRIGAATRELRNQRARWRGMMRGKFKHRDHAIFRIAQTIIGRIIAELLRARGFVRRHEYELGHASIADGQFISVKIDNVDRAHFAGIDRGQQEEKYLDDKQAHVKDVAAMPEFYNQAQKTLSIFAVFFTLTSCDRMMTPRETQASKDAQAETLQGNYSRAISLYESALDDSPRAAEIHYQLAVLYDDKLKDPLDALHHFKRYLTLEPNGRHANEAKEIVERDEVALVTALSGDAVLTRADAARLRNENLNLRKQLEERAPKTKLAAAAAAKAAPEKSSVPRSYTVEAGDTLFSIARKFYKSPARWKEIREANSGKIDNPGKLKPGTRLTIP